MASRNLQRCLATLDMLHPARGRHIALLLNLNDPSASPAIDVNRCAEAALEPMRAQAGGKIINIASVYGMVGVDAGLYGGSPVRPMRNFAYTWSKRALVILTREMAVSWAPYGINVNAFSPGMFPVEANMNEWPTGTFERIRQRIPLERTGSATDLKGALVFLSSAASEYVTDHNLVVDGGRIAW